MSDPARHLREQLHLAQPETVEHQRTDPVDTEGYTRHLVRYEGAEGDDITAFFFNPKVDSPIGGVLAFHQHAGEFHYGKSEVAGEVGSALQAFGPALANRGVAVLAPDAITFEDRRTGASGCEPREDDWEQHYNSMAYRLINNDLLMRKCLDDAQRALSVLMDQPEVDPDRVGVLGHSYGGTTAMYHAALDPRVRFACVSGATCSLETRQRNHTSINMFEVVPGLTAGFDVHRLIQAISPRPALIVSATRDPYSNDADLVVERASVAGIDQFRVEGEHPLDDIRFEVIVDWIENRSSV